MAAVREQECQLIMDEPHAVMLDDKGASWNVWCGARRTDEQQIAVGFYRWYAAPTQDDPDKIWLEFRPLVAGLMHEQAAFFAQALAQEMNGDMDKLQELAGLINGMSADQHEALIAELSGYEQAARQGMYCPILNVGRASIQERGAPSSGNICASNPCGQEDHIRCT